MIFHNYRYSSLEAQKLLSADFKFICSSCCPIDRLQNAKSEPYYRLIEVDKQAKLNDVQVLQKKLDVQLSGGVDDDGIFDLLYQLKDMEVIRNLPSDNRKRGIATSKIVDTDVQHEVDFNLTSKTANKVHKKKAAQYAANQGNGFSISIETVDEDTVEWESDEVVVKKPKEATLPEFLRDSRVRTAEDMLREASVLGLSAGGGGIGDSMSLAEMEKLGSSSSSGNIGVTKKMDTTDSQSLEIGMTSSSASGSSSSTMVIGATTTTTIRSSSSTAAAAMAAAALARGAMEIVGAVKEEEGGIDSGGAAENETAVVEEEDDDVDWED
jgi:hypothetical protein